jgi:hypothetical protein
MKKLIGILLLVCIGAAIYQASTAISTRLTLNTWVGSRLDEVDANTMDQVRQSVIGDAGKLGVALKPAQIVIQYEDSNVESAAQRLVGKIGMQFQNKRVTIKVRYDANICGVPWAQEIRQTKLKQVAAAPPPAQREAQRILDREN